MTRWILAGTALGGWIAPAVVLAEVMDKETVPWAPERLGGTLAVVGVCSLLIAWARRLRRSRWKIAPMLLAGLLAALWAFGGATDDFYSADVGPAMRQEMGPGASVAYEVMLPVEALIPLVAVLLLLLFGGGSKGVIKHL